MTVDELIAAAHAKVVEVEGLALHDVVRVRDALAAALNALRSSVLSVPAPVEEPAKSEGKPEARKRGS